MGVIADLEQQGIMAFITKKKQVTIFDRKYSIAKTKLRFLIGRAEPATAQDAKKQAPVSFPNPAVRCQVRRN
jgi:hypothetical protein